MMLTPRELDAQSIADSPRLLAEAYVAPAVECEKSISHHYRDRRPGGLIQLVPDLGAELAAVIEAIVDGNGARA